MRDSIDAILLDWGGTLASVDRQVRSWVEGAEQAARQLFAAGMPAPDTAIQDLLTCFEHIQQETHAKRSCRELDFDKVLRVWFKKLKLSRPSPAMLATVTDLFWQPWTESLDPIDGALTAVAEIVDAGYPTVLVSNTEAPPAYAEQQLSRMGFGQYLAAAVFSSGVGRRKPHKKIYAAAIDALNRTGHAVAPGRALFVGDSPECDVAGPAAIGMHTALIRNSSTERNFTSEQYAQVQPELTISHVRELLDYLPRR